jgi:hypothetical protein
VLDNSANSIPEFCRRLSLGLLCSAIDGLRDSGIDHAALLRSECRLRRNRIAHRVALSLQSGLDAGREVEASKKRCSRIQGPRLSGTGGMFKTIMRRLSGLV